MSQEAANPGAGHHREAVAPPDSAPTGAFDTDSIQSTISVHGFEHEQVGEGGDLGRGGVQEVREGARRTARGLLKSHSMCPSSVGHISRLILVQPGSGRGLEIGVPGMPGWRFGDAIEITLT